MALWGEHKGYDDKKNNNKFQTVSMHNPWTLREMRSSKLLIPNSTHENAREQKPSENVARHRNRDPTSFYEKQ